MMGDILLPRDQFHVLIFGIVNHGVRAFRRLYIQRGHRWFRPLLFSRFLLLLLLSHELSLLHHRRILFSLRHYARQMILLVSIPMNQLGSFRLFVVNDGVRRTFFSSFAPGFL